MGKCVVCVCAERVSVDSVCLILCILSSFLFGVVGTRPLPPFRKESSSWRYSSDRRSYHSCTLPRDPSWSSRDGALLANSLRQNHTTGREDTLFDDEQFFTLLDS